MIEPRLLISDKNSISEKVFPVSDRERSKSEVIRYSLEAEWLVYASFSDIVLILKLLFVIFLFWLDVSLWASVKYLHIVSSGHKYYCPDRQWLGKCLRPSEIPQQPPLRLLASCFLFFSSASSDPPAPVS